MLCLSVFAAAPGTKALSIIVQKLVINLGWVGLAVLSTKTCIFQK